MNEPHSGSGRWEGDRTYDVHHLDSSDNDGVCGITLVGFDIVPVHHLAFHGEGGLGNMGNFDRSTISPFFYSLSEWRDEDLLGWPLRQAR